MRKGKLLNAPHVAALLRTCDPQRSHVADSMHKLGMLGDVGRNLDWRFISDMNSLHPPFSVGARGVRHGAT